MPAARCPRCKRSWDSCRSADKQTTKKSYIFRLSGRVAFFCGRWAMEWMGCAVLAFATTVAWMPSLLALSWRMGAVDVPRDARRMHRDTVPRCGGLSIMAAVLLSYALLWREATPLWGAVAGGLLMLTLGLVDDIHPLPALAKLGVQGIASCLTARLLGMRGLAFLGSVLWILLLTNAHNFIDGLDSLFGGVSCIEGVGLCLFLLGMGERAGAGLSLCIAAACAGFLVFNRPPARIFAGDCGSGSVGFLLGALSLPAFRAGVGGLSSLSPLFLFAYPLVDLSSAVARRLLRGKNPFAADRAHLHHRLVAMGLSHGECALCLQSLSALLVAVGVLIGREGMEEWALLAVLVTLVWMEGARRFLLHFAKNS